MCAPREVHGAVAAARAPQAVHDSVVAIFRGVIRVGHEVTKADESDDDPQDAKEEGTDFNSVMVGRLDGQSEDGHP